MQRIGVWNTAFLGDAVLTLPLLQSLRLRYPEADVDFYVRAGLEPLFLPHPALRAVYGYDKRGREGGLSGTMRLRGAIASRGYDLWISAHTSARSGFLARSSGAGMLIGYASAVCGALWYTHRVDRRFTELEEIERLLALLQPLGPGATVAWPELALGRAEREAADSFFSGLAGPVLGMHPGSVWGTKRWPANYFAEIAVWALREGADVVLFAGPGEEAVAAQVKDGILQQAGSAAQKRLHDCSGALPLPLLAAYLGRLSCYLTNDSGPMHMAWAQGTPVTALFGPTVGALGFFPRGEGSTVFEVPEPCRPCGLHGPALCPLGHHHCMTRISPEAVWPDVRRKLWPAPARRVD